MRFIHLPRLNNCHPNYLGVSLNAHIGVRNPSNYLLLIKFKDQKNYATLSNNDNNDSSSINNNNNNIKDSANINNNNINNSKRLTKDDLDTKILDIIHSYPESKLATPYEILNISNSNKKSIKPKELKQIFFKLAKIYHPDSSHAHGYPLRKDKFFCSNNLENLKPNELLNSSIKDERFKKILAAYNLLKNPITKSNYDNYNIGWLDCTNLRTNPNMYNPSSNEYKNNFNGSNSGPFYRSNFTSYETGTWEDRYKYGYDRAYGFYNDNNWSSSKTGDFKEEFMKNKKTIFLSLILTISVYGALQLSHLYLYDDLIGENYNTSLSSSNVDIHEKSEDDLFHAYTNYGLGDSKQDRINRFLWWRKLSMTFSLADIKEVLDNFYKRGVIDPSSNEDSTKLKQFDYHIKKD
jgi:curved DNA-binding protein CbpA